ncbi:hypothetical protein ZWY2020_045325 [Hordeum vulgare]|nr:hypothetical protein ZWY2020_045325 [Hordeum vulgare]
MDQSIAWQKVVQDLAGDNQEIREKLREITGWFPSIEMMRNHARGLIKYRIRGLVEDPLVCSSNSGDFVHNVDFTGKKGCLVGDGVDLALSDDSDMEVKYNMDNTATVHIYSLQTDNRMEKDLVSKPENVPLYGGVGVERKEIRASASLSEKDEMVEYYGRDDLHRRGSCSTSDMESSKVRNVVKQVQGFSPGDGTTVQEGNKMNMDHVG